VPPDGRAFAITKLAALQGPHMKSLAGAADLFELRLRQRNAKARPIFIRRDETYLIVAVAADHAKDMRGPIDDARQRI
jgi:hypothetical protein